MEDMAAQPMAQRTEGLQRLERDDGGLSIFRQCQCGMARHTRIGVLALPLLACTFGQPTHASPHDWIPRHRVVGAREIAAELRKFFQGNAKEEAPRGISYCS